VTVGSVLEQSLALYQRFFWRFALTTAVVMVFLNLISALAATADSGSGAFFFWGILNVIVGLVGTFWVQGALTFAVDDVRDGRIDTTIGELYRRTQPFLGALVVAGLLAAIGIGIGLVLLIAPGLYLLARWALIVPAIVLEKRSAGEAFTRSSELTDGHRWTVLGVAVIVLVAGAVIGGIARGILGVILPTFFGAWLGGLAANCITTPFIALAFTVMYFQLARPPAEVGPTAPLAVVE
jgi:Membrane domain of glycerophosphoryl diester phosphodiesterase